MKKIAIILIIPIVFVAGVLIYKFSFLNKVTKGTSLISNIQEKLNSEVIYKQNLDGDKKQDLINKINNNSSIGEFNYSKTSNDGKLKAENNSKSINSENDYKKIANNTESSNSLINNNLGNNNLVSHIIDEIIGKHDLVEKNNGELNLQTKEKEITNLEKVKIFMRENFNNSEQWEFGIANINVNIKNTVIRKYIVQPKKVYKNAIDKINDKRIEPKNVTDINKNSNTNIAPNSVNKNNIKMDNNIDLKNNTNSNSNSNSNSNINKGNNTNNIINKENIDSSKNNKENIENDEKEIDKNKVKNSMPKKQILENQK